MKILAIDDNPDNLTSLKAVVADRLPGVDVITALNGPRGIDLAGAEDPDVILLDIVMPGMDGYAVCSHLKGDSILRHIPVLFLTALRTDRGSRVKALEVGADGFLTKPFDEEELIAQIRAMVKIKAAALAQRQDKEQLEALVAERTRELKDNQQSILKLLDDLRAENEARKQSERMLQLGEVELRCVLETCADGILAISSPGKVIHANRRFAEIWRIPTSLMEAGDDQALLRHVMSQLVNPESFLRKVEALYASADDDIELLHFKDGRFVERFSSPLVMEGALVGRVWSFRDITARQQAEDAISRQLAELQRWQAVTLGREDRIAELKCEVNTLAVRLGEARPYATPEELEARAQAQGFPTSTQRESS